MLFESCNCEFGGNDSVIVGWDKGNVHMIISYVCFDGLGAFIVRYIEDGCIPAGVEEVGKNVCECCNHGTIIFGRHGMDKNCIWVVNVHHKHILHVAEGLHGEGTSAVGVHCHGV